MAGRIGNQLFMYAAARTLQYMRGNNEEIIVDDRINVPLKYENSLEHYPLSGVKFVHDDKLLITHRFWKQRLCFRIINKIERKMNYEQRDKFEKKWQSIFNKMGVVYCENGVVDFPTNNCKDIYMWGYFQSEKYFQSCKEELIEKFSLIKEVETSDYPNLEEIRNRNTVCISIKVQHNVGNEMYDVCSEDYWKTAIRYITERVPNPLFFVCSDNISYVKENLIDFSEYDVVVQDASYPVHISLAVMAQCKHFIIGNTSFGWWAQYLSKNPNKIVVAPSRWYGIDIPCDIYLDNWHLIEV